MDGLDLDWFYLPLSTLELTYTLSIVFIAGVLRGLAGFGFSALCFFALAPVFSAQTIVPLMFAMEVMASVHLLPKVWRQIPWRWVAILCLGTLFGTPLGVVALQYWQSDLVRGLAGGGVLIACFALWRQWHFKAAETLIWLAMAGFVSGFVNGLASIGGLVVAVYMLSSNMPLTAMRAGLILFFLLTDVYGLFWLNGHNLISKDLPSLLLIMMPVMLIANQIGYKLFDRIDMAVMRKFTLGLLSGLAATAMYSAISQ
ncbi:MAG: sulfite exporter TauE/SafE family protein [Gammaproteobacteria bacterium]|nr:sulfite exporter TauE/SafE family protein [Gammaproteobacteria bacterium]